MQPQTQPYNLSLQGWIVGFLECMDNFFKEEEDDNEEKETLG